MIYLIYIMQSQTHQEKVKDSEQDAESLKIKAYWNNFVPVYSLMDSAMQTFYYTLINILDISKAKNILEVACGTGRLLPLAISIKPTQCKYLASDLSENMVESAKQYLKNYIQKLGVQSSLESWMKLQNLQLKVLNGEQKIETAQPFDRVICNLVLMLAANPVKMMKNLHSLAAEGCLMGVTIWGDKKLSNLLTIADHALQEWGEPLPQVRSNFHLYNKLPELCAQTGWQIVVQWQQIVPHSFTELDDNLMRFVDLKAQNQEKMRNYHIEKITETFKQQKTLNFPAQMAVLRKK